MRVIVAAQRRKKGAAETTSSTARYTPARAIVPRHTSTVSLGIVPSQVGIDGARGSLALMSNESMIRGGGPEAWRHLDLADEAKSKPLPLPLHPPSCSFSTSASSYSRLIFLLF